VEQVVEPVTHLLAIGSRHAEQLADDHRGDERAELLDVVELFRSGELIQVAVGERGDERFDVVHASRREGAVAQPVVFRRVHETSTGLHGSSGVSAAPCEG
jgi:hypothetical protein